MAEPTIPRPHRLLHLLHEAAAGRFPEPDLGVEVLPSAPGRSDAVVAFSGHNVVAAPLSEAEVRAHLPDDDPGGPMLAPFLAWLGQALDATPGSLDLVLVADGSGSGAAELVARDDADAHARVERALRYRSVVSVYSDRGRSGVVTIGRGLAERWEVSVEVDPAARGRGIGAALARAAIGLVPAGELLFAQVAPGNVASVRAFLGAGYRPICSEVLFLR